MFGDDEKHKSFHFENFQEFRKIFDRPRNVRRNRVFSEIRQVCQDSIMAL